MSHEITRVTGQHMNVNSYVIHGPEGAVVVDGQLCRDDGKRVGQALAATGLPLAGVVLTHGHPTTTRASRRSPRGMSRSWPVAASTRSSGAMTPSRTRSSVR